MRAASILDRRYCAALLLSFGALLWSGCKERGEPAQTSEDAPQATQPASQGPLLIHKLDVPELGASLIEGSPTPEAVTEALKHKLAEVKALQYKPQAQPTVTLRFSFELKRQDDPERAKAPVLFMRWRCELIRFPVNTGLEPLPMDERLVARQLLKPDDELASIPQLKATPSVAALVLEVAASCVDSLDGQLRVQAATDEQLNALLDDSLVGAAAQRALERVRDAQTLDPKVAPKLRPFLDRDDPQLVLAAAGVLARLKDREAAAPMIEAASKLSEQGNLRDLVALVYVMGELGGSGVIPYLEALATGHADVQVRDAAQESLRRAQRP